MPPKMPVPAQQQGSSLIDLANPGDIGGTFQERKQAGNPRQNENIPFLDLTNPFQTQASTSKESPPMRFVTRDGFPRDDNDKYQSRNTIDYYELRESLARERRQNAGEGPAKAAEKAPDSAALSPKEVRPQFEQISRTGANQIMEGTACKNQTVLGAALG